MGVLSLITIILLLLNAFGVITIPWLWVFVPLIIEVLFWLVMFATVGIGATRGIRRMF